MNEETRDLESVSMSGVGTVCTKYLPCLCCGKPGNSAK